MLQKEEKKRIDFTGFVATYSNGRVVYERENFYSRKLKKQCATSWDEIDKNRLVSLELQWHGEPKVKVDKIPDPKENLGYNELGPTQWFFSQSGSLDMANHKVLVVSRNIGYKVNGTCHISSVMEDTGVIRMHSRAA